MTRAKIENMCSGKTRERIKLLHDQCQGRVHQCTSDGLSCCDCSLVKRSLDMFGIDIIYDYERL